MTCPTCNHINPATAVRCLNCGTTLIYEAVGHSEDYKKATRALDLKIHTGVGAVLGFFAVILFIKIILADHWFSEQEIYSYGFGGAIAGSTLGRIVLKIKNEI